MEVIVEKIGDVAVVTPQGTYLDVSNAKEFKRNAVPTLKTNSVVVFDLSHLRFVDSTGIGVILGCLRELNNADGDLKLCGVSKPVRALFELVRMHRILEIFNTKEDAVRAFQAVEEAV